MANVSETVKIEYVEDTVNGKKIKREIQSFTMNMTEIIFAPNSFDRMILSFEEYTNCYDEKGNPIVSNNFGMKLRRIYQQISNDNLYLKRAYTICMGTFNDEIKSLLGQILAFVVGAKGKIEVKRVQKFKGEQREETNDVYTSDLFKSDLVKLLEAHPDEFMLNILFPKLMDAVSRAKQAPTQIANVSAFGF